MDLVRAGGRLVPTRITRARDQALRSRRAVLEHADLLRPGRFHMTGDGLWRHESTALPDHLFRTKAWHTGSRLARARRRLRTAVLPTSFTISSRADANGYGLAVVSYDGGVLLLDPGRGSVARTMPQGGSFTEGYADRRRALARHVPCPSFELSPGGRVLVEEYIEGSHVLTLPAARQIDVLREVLHGFTSLVRTCGATGGDDVRTAWAIGREVARSGELAEVLAAPPPAVTDGAWLHVPAPTDATIRNVVVHPTRGPLPIDLGDIRVEPFFVYPVGLVLNTRPHGLAAFLDGALDESLEGLFDAAAKPWPWDPTGRLALIALRVAVVALHEATTGVGVVDTERFRVALHRRWEAVRSGQPVLR